MIFSPRFQSESGFESDRRPEPNVRQPHKIINQVSCLKFSSKKYQIHMNPSFVRVRKHLILSL